MYVYLLDLKKALASHAQSIWPRKGNRSNISSYLADVFQKWKKNVNDSQDKPKYQISEVDNVAYISFPMLSSEDVTNQESLDAVRGPQSVMNSYGNNWKRY